MSEEEFRLSAGLGAAHPAPDAGRRPEPIRVLIADDHALFRRGLEMVLDEEDDIELVGQASDGAEAQLKAAESLPDVVLMDIRMPKSSGIEACRAMKEAAPMTIDQALFEMELVGHDFYLFRDKESGCSSVVYRRCGYRYGVIRLVETQVPGQPERLVAS